MSNALTVSGGGWATHTATAALLSAILQKAAKDNLVNKSNNFQELLGSFERVSGVSGGNWFLTMLAYSPSFERDLATDSGNLFTNGYMADQKKVFKDAPSEEKLKASFENALKPAVKDIVDRVFDQMDTAALQIFNKVNGRSIVTDKILSQVISSVYPLISSNEALGKEMLAVFLNSDLRWSKFVSKTAFSDFNLFTKPSNKLERNQWAEDVTIMSGASVDYGLTASDDGSSRTPDGGIVPRNLKDKNFTDLDLLKYYWGDEDPSKRSYVHPLSIVDFPSKIQKKDSLQFLDSDRYFIGSTGEKLKRSYDLDASLMDISTISGSFLGWLGGTKIYNDILASIAPSLEQSIKDNLAKTYEQVAHEYFQSKRKDIIEQNPEDNNERRKLLSDVDTEQKYLDGILGGVQAIGIPIVSSVAAKYRQPISNDIDPQRVYQNVMGTAPNALARKLSNLSPAISLKNDSASTSDLSGGWVHRYLDGGVVDNTGAAIAIQDIQKVDGIANPAELTLIVNNTLDKPTDPLETLQTADGTVITVAGDAKKLFSRNPNVLPFDPVTKPFSENLHYDTDFNAAYPYIFDVPKIVGTQFISTVDKTTLAIQTLETVTVDNDQFGIKAGQKVRLTLVSTITKDSYPGPANNQLFDSYQGMYSSIRNSIDAIDTTSWQQLASAFGIGAKASRRSSSELRRLSDPITGTLSAPSRYLTDASDHNVPADDITAPSPSDLGRTQFLWVKDTRVTVKNNTLSELFVKTRNAESDADGSFTLRPGETNNTLKGSTSNPSKSDVAFDVFDSRNRDTRKRLGFFAFHNPFLQTPYRITDVNGKLSGTSITDRGGGNRIDISPAPQLVGRQDDSFMLPPIFSVSGDNSRSDYKDWTLAVEVI